MCPRRWPSPRAFTLELVMTPKRSTPFRNHPDHPLRPPEWRWLAARSQWDQGGGPSDPRDDVWVRKALRLHRALKQEKDLQKRTQLSALFQAHQLYCDESL